MIREIQKITCWVILLLSIHTPFSAKASVDTVKTNKYEKWEFESGTSYSYHLGAADIIYDYEKGLLKDKRIIGEIQKYYKQEIVKESYPDANSRGNNFRYIYINNNKVVLSEYNELNEEQLKKCKSYILTSTHPPRYNLPNGNLGTELFYPEDAPKFRPGYKNFDFENRVNSGLLYIQGAALFFDPASGYLIHWRFSPGEMQEAFIRYAKYKNCDRIIPTETQKMEYAIKASANPGEVKLDGSSTVEIVATLYEYPEGSDKASIPLAGKMVDFIINEQNGITPGKLSTLSAITNTNGQAFVVFTAPDSELLGKATLLVNTATVTAKSKDYGCEDMAYIRFIADKGKVTVEPSIGGITSSRGIVPPDKRFPALIRAYIEDENLKPKTNAEITFTIAGDNSYGLLRGEDGKESKKIVSKTDANGIAEVQYIFTDKNIPEKPVSDRIEINSKGLAMTLNAEISIGLNIVFDSVENGYEGKGVINAGEEIPLRVKIRDAWNPELDLNEVLNYWGFGNKTGNDMTFVRLEVEKLGSVPDYLLDHLQITKYPEQPFAEIMTVKSFKDKGELNMLWMPESTLKTYRGYPRICPKAAGTSYYEARVFLTDNQGKVIFPVNHPASKSFLTINTGVDADKFKIFINLNPFGPHSKYTQALREALAYKYGTVISIVDALDAINRGDVEGLYGLLFGEIKGAILDKVKSKSAFNEEIVEGYSKIALAEKIHFDILRDRSGYLAQLDAAVFKQLSNVFNANPCQIIILTGVGTQKLFEDLKASQPEDSKSDETKETATIKDKLKVAAEVTGKVASNTIKQIGNVIRGSGKEIPVKEGAFVNDDKRKTISFKNGATTIYLIPTGMNVRYENAFEIKKY
ncbi:MAG: Ig-like domain-containing protein [Bacteroidales bacterium]|jgi:hypothetical protein